MSSEPRKRLPRDTANTTSRCPAHLCLPASSIVANDAVHLMLTSSPNPLPPTLASPGMASLPRPPCWTPRFTWSPARFLVHLRPVLHAVARSAVLTRSFTQVPLCLRTLRCLHVELGTDETRSPSAATPPGPRPPQLPHLLPYSSSCFRASLRL